MPQFRSILCAGDFSESSKKAFRLACSLAVESKTRVVVLHVAEPNWVAETPVYSGQQTIPFTVAERDASALTAFERQMRETYVPSHPVEIEYATREGKPADEILRAAGENGCDLIVMGTSGRKGLQRLLYGSVAEAVLRGAHCTVLVRNACGRSPESDQIRTVLCPTDFSEASDEALRVARLVARDQGARLIVLAVVPIDTNVAEVPTLYTDTKPYQDALHEISRRLDGLDLKFPIEARVVVGTPAFEIVRGSEDDHCDLIVMGSHGRTGLGRFLLGSVAESVLRDAGRPVVVVKAPKASPRESAGDSTAKTVTVF